MAEAPETRLPLVLLHGWGGSYATTWAGSPLEAEVLAQDRMLIGLDLPGHGRGSASHDPADYEFLVDRVSAALPSDEVLDGVGFSLGGKILLAMASEQPHRFRRLVIAGVGANAFRPEAGDVVSSALLEGIPPDAPRALRTVVEEALASGNDPRALSAVIRRPPHPLCPRQLNGVLAEVLLVVGSDDAIAGAPEPLAQALPAVHTIVIDGLNHVTTPSSNELARAAATFIAAGFCPPT